jgi:D-alanyl-D-alanine carboxypeptidase/D-alanyl-D-alanine-endopeptidase (penicillin-binding protein 4)
MMNKLFFILLPLLLSVQLYAQNGEKLAEDENDAVAADSLGSTTEYADTAAVDHDLPWPQSVQQRLDKLLEHGMFDTSQVGLMVYDLTADSCIYRVNERQMLRPASTMKVITAIAAIDCLGGSYQFRTSLYYTGTIENNTLTGDVYCVGGFDPRFNSDDMTAFVEGIHRMGVDTIRGRIVMDRTMKTAELLGEGWCWDDDNPQLSPLLVGRKDRFAERFMQDLRDAGIVVEAYNSEGALPNGAYIVCTRFHSLDQVLMRMMKESDNLYAESMFYQIAASTGNRPADAGHARAVIQRLIGKLGLPPKAYKIADGSGLSLYNYVSAELEIRMLRYAYLNSNIYLHLYPSLPIAGQDGTLKNRMRNPFTNGNVRAKTGTLTGISSLAGYCTASNGHQLCFAIINQGVMHGKNARDFQDRVCTVLCQPYFGLQITD